MTTVADALEVMAVVAACHHRTAPRMDDREVALATAAVWAELFDPHEFTTAELIAAVKRRAQMIADAPEPADIIRVARETRRDEAEREPDEIREARQAAIDARIAEHVEEIAEARSLKFQRPSEIHGANPLAVHCPWCNAGPGTRCTIPMTQQPLREGYHPSRVEAAMEVGA